MNTPIAAAHAVPVPAGSSVPGLPLAPDALPPVAVLVLEDRAHVLRRGRVTAGVGRRRLTLEHVSPAIHDRTLRVRSADPDGLRVTAARIARVPRGTLVRDGGGLTAALERRLRVQEEIRDLKRRLQEGRGERQRLELIRARFWEDVEADVAAGLDETADWEACLAELDRETDALADRRAELRVRLETAEAELAAADREAAAAREAATELCAVLEIELECLRDGEFPLEVDYLVGGAAWRPRHRATLTGADERHLRFELGATVWQATGEDWTGVRLAVSTHRPNPTGELPQLMPDVLRTRKRPPNGPTPGHEARESDPRGERQRTQPGRIPTEMPGIDVGGDVLRLESPSTASIPSDGRPHRLSLTEFTAEVEPIPVVAAEVSDAAWLRTRQANPLPFPLLAGPTTLVRQGGVAAETAIGRVEPGASFDLAWGCEGEVRVRTEGTLVREVRLRNLGDRPQTVTPHAVASDPVPAAIALGPYEDKRLS